MYEKHPGERTPPEPSYTIPEIAAVVRRVASELTGNSPSMTICIDIVQRARDRAKVKAGRDWPANRRRGNIPIAYPPHQVRAMLIELRTETHNLGNHSVRSAGITPNITDQATTEL